MTREDLRFPFIPRTQQLAQVQRCVRTVVASRESRAVLVHGSGGVGKTYFIRQLPRTLCDGSLCWLGPYDMDDPEHWLLTNLEAAVAGVLDPERRYFAPYWDHQLKLPRVQRLKLGLEGVLPSFRRGQALFARCYNRFIAQSERTPVIILDTMEAVRGLDLQVRLVRWLKELQGTVFVLASRPLPEDQQGLTEELGSPPGLPCVALECNRFTEQESLAYLSTSSVTATLAVEAKRALAEMAQGFPLWLVMAVAYLDQRQVLPELQGWAAATPVERGRLQDHFIRRLLVPYSDWGFWSEAIKRLAVVRRRVDSRIWSELMADCKLPAEVATPAQAWQQLLKWPWVRVRTRRDHVTLHDAVAEQLARRVIPLDDADHSWREALWTRAAAIYRRLAEEGDAAVDGERKRLQAASDRAPLSSAEVLQAEVTVADHWLLVSTAFYYQALADRESAVHYLVELYDWAEAENAPRLIQLLWIELQRALGAEQVFDPLDDIVKPQFARFREWFWRQEDLSYQVGRRFARFLMHNGRPEEAFDLLDRLLNQPRADEARYDLLKLRGNARARVPKQWVGAQRDFDEALGLTELEGASDTVRAKRGEALTELAWYYRVTGRWPLAVAYYERALRATGRRDRQQLAKIRSQYGYVLALMGRYGDAWNMVVSAMGLQGDDASPVHARTLGIKGDVSRFGQQFQAAMDAYREAYRLAEAHNELGLLGMVSSQVAICSFQAGETEATVYTSAGPVARNIREWADEAVVLCRDYYQRELPIALNRAGRIYMGGPQASRLLEGSEATRALRYLREGVEAAREIGDTWMLVANLIEYATFCVKAWLEQSDPEALSRFRICEPEITAEFADLLPDAFEALRGRWEVLQGHLILKEVVDQADPGHSTSAAWQAAFPLYRDGFAKIAWGYAGPRASRALKQRSTPLVQLMRKLPAEQVANWLDALEREWKAQPQHATRRWPLALDWLLTEWESDLGSHR